jgi:cell division inhibitor SulA
MQQLSLSTDNGFCPSVFSIPQELIGKPPQNKGSLTEIRVYDDSAIPVLQFLPLLAQCVAQKRWLMWLSAERTLNKEWLASMGLGQTPVLHLTLCTDTQMVLCSKILQAGNSHLIIEWQGELTQIERSSLRQCAQQSGSQVLLIQKLA